MAKAKTTRKRKPAKRKPAKKLTKCLDCAGIGSFDGGEVECLDCKGKGKL